MPCIKKRKIPAISQEKSYSIHMVFCQYLLLFRSWKWEHRSRPIRKEKAFHRNASTSTIHNSFLSHGISSRCRNEFTILNYNKWIYLSSMEEEKGKCRISFVRNSMKLPVSFLEKPKLYEITPQFPKQIL